MKTAKAIQYVHVYIKSLYTENNRKTHKHSAGSTSNSRDNRVWSDRAMASVEAIWCRNDFTPPSWAHNIPSYFHSYTADFIMKSAKIK